MNSFAILPVSAEKVSEKIIGFIGTLVYNTYNISTVLYSQETAAEIGPSFENKYFILKKLYKFNKIRKHSRNSKTDI